MNMKEKGYHITLYADGIKKRCRKTDRHSIKLYSGTPDLNTLGQEPINTEAIIKVAKATIARELKSCDTAFVLIKTVEFETYEGMTIMTATLYDKRDIKVNVFDEVDKEEVIKLLHEQNEQARGE